MGKAAKKNAAAKAFAKHKRSINLAPTTAERGTALWWGGLGCGGMVVLSPASAILLAALVAPVLLVTLLPEDGPGRRITTAALLFGLAGSVRPLHQLWDTEATISGATTIMQQPIVLLTSWTAILAGWFVGEFAGVVLKLLADANAATRRRSYTAELAALEEEWGTLAPPTTIITT